MVRCNAMSMTEEEFRRSSAGAATAAVCKAIPMVRCNVLAWTDEKEEYKVSVTSADHIACTTVVKRR
jgi:hypothetical protein